MCTLLRVGGVDNMLSCLHTQNLMITYQISASTLRILKLSYKEQHSVYLPLIFLKSLQRLIHDCPSVGADVTPVSLQQFI